MSHQGRRITQQDLTTAHVRALITSWCAAHPGYDESNWLDCFRNEHGELIESDEFEEAAYLFAPPR